MQICKSNPVWLSIRRASIQACSDNDLNVVNEYFPTMGGESWVA
jgi:hypothetical protein